MSEQYFVGLALPEDHPWQKLRHELLQKVGKPYTVGLHITIVQPFTTDAFDQCERIVGEVAKEFEPVAVDCDGLGVFMGEKEALYIKVDAPQVIILHNQLLIALKDCIHISGEIHPTYKPHLTLAHKLNTAQREKVEGEIKEQSLKEDLILDQLVLYKLTSAVGDEGQTKWQEQRVWQLRP